MKNLPKLGLISLILISQQFSIADEWPEWVESKARECRTMENSESTNALKLIECEKERVDLQQRAIKQEKNIEESYRSKIFDALRSFFGIQTKNLNASLLDQKNDLETVRSINNRYSQLFQNYFKNYSQEMKIFREVIQPMPAQYSKGLGKLIAPTQGSSDLQKIAKAKVDIQSYRERTGEYLIKFNLTVQSTQNQIANLKELYLADISPLLEKIKEQGSIAGLQLPFDKAINNLEKVIGFVKTLQDQIGQTSDALIAKLQYNSDSLIAKQVDQRVDAELKTSRQLTIASKFLSQVSDLISEFKKPPESSKIAGLKFLSDYYQRQLDFVNFESICQDIKPESPLISGCQEFKQYLGPAKQMTTSGISFSIKLNLASIQRKGITLPAQQKEKLLSLVSSKQLGAAIELNDYVIKSLEAKL